MAVHSHIDHGHDQVVIVDAHAHSVLLIVGRLIFGAYFLYAGIDHFLNHEMLAGFAAAHGVPWPTLAVLGTGALLVVGGLGVMTGLAPRLGAAAIALFLIGVTPVMHAFWNDATPAEHAADLVNFTKNIALLGATAFVAETADAWRTVSRRFTAVRAF